MREGIIYKIVCGNTFLIGSTLNPNNRKSWHIGELERNRHTNSYLQKSYNKYKQFEFLILQNNIPEDILLFVEDIWIGSMCSKIQDKKGGANMKDASRPNLTQEIKDKISMKGKGKKKIKTIEQIEKHRKAMIGKVPSQQHRKNISNSLKGRLPSDLCIENSIKKSSKKTYQYDLEGNFIQGFKSANEANRQIGGKNDCIANICRNEKGKYMEFQWRYYKKDKIESYVENRGKFVRKPNPLKKQNNGRRGWRSIYRHV